MTTPVLAVKDIIKDFPGVRALDKVCFEVHPGEVHALCGENGAGKSTLMHIMAGVYKQDSGEIYLDGQAIEVHGQKHANDIGVSIVYQERSLVNSLSVAENIFAGRHPVKKLGFVDAKEMNRQSNELLKNLGMDISPLSMVGDLAPPQQQMVEIAKALSVNPKVIIFDEPTASITDAEVESLFEMIKLLKSRGIAIIYISHRLAEIFEIADRVTVFKDGKHIETAQVADVDIKWLINRMVGRDLTFDRWEHPVEGDVTLRVKGLYGAKFNNISFHVREGEIIGFAGLAGAGRTEVMRSVFGADRIHAGTVEIAGKKTKLSSPIDAIRSGMGYLPEDRKEQGLFLEMSITENIVSASLDQFQKGILIFRENMDRISEEYKDRLGIVTPSIKQKTLNLSGGNQQKVIIAKWLQVNPRILIVDEPTRGVDVGTKAEIYSILRKLVEGGTSIILVSSELPEILAMSDRIYVMADGKITAEMVGSDATEATVLEYAYGYTSLRKELF